MYFKRNIKEKGGESYLHYRLCESYRDSERIRNRTLLTLGDFEKILPDAHQQRTFISRMEEIYYEGKDNPLPGFVDAKVEPLAHYYARELRELESGIVRVMNSQSMVTTTILNTKNETIAVRKCSEPEENVKRIYDAIGYKDRPFIMTKKICSPPT